MYRLCRVSFSLLISPSSAFTSVTCLFDIGLTTFGCIDTESYVDKGIDNLDNCVTIT